MKLKILGLDKSGRFKIQCISEKEFFEKEAEGADSITKSESIQENMAEALNVLQKGINDFFPYENIELVREDHILFIPVDVLFPAEDYIFGYDLDDSVFDFDYSANVKDPLRNLFIKQGISIKDYDELLKTIKSIIVKEGDHVLKTIVEISIKYFKEKEKEKSKDECIEKQKYILKENIIKDSIESLQGEISLVLQLRDHNIKYGRFGFVCNNIEKLLLLSEMISKDPEKILSFKKEWLEILESLSAPKADMKNLSKKIEVLMALLFKKYFLIADNLFIQQLPLPSSARKSEGGFLVHAAIMKNVHDMIRKINDRYNAISSSLESIAVVGQVSSDIFTQKDRLYISRLDAYIQRCGIGTILMKYICESAKNKNLHVELIATSDAIPFYKKFFEKHYNIKLNMAIEDSDLDDKILLIHNCTLKGMAPSLKDKPEKKLLFSFRNEVILPQGLLSSKRAEPQTISKSATL